MGATDPRFPAQQKYIPQMKHGVPHPLRLGQRVARGGHGPDAPRGLVVFSVTQGWQPYHSMSSRAEPAGSLAKQPAQSRDPYSLDAKSRLQRVSQEKLPLAAAPSEKTQGSLDSDSRAGAWSPSLGMTGERIR